MDTAEPVTTSDHSTLAAEHIETGAALLDSFAAQNEALVDRNLYPYEMVIARLLLGIGHALLSLMESSKSSDVKVASSLSEIAAKYFPNPGQ